MVQLWSLVAVAAVAAVLPSTANAIPSYGSCPASDKCLKAVKANGSPAALKDCKAALWKTVISGKPCTKTVFAKSTKTVTQTKVLTNTAFSTVTTITVTPTQQQQSTLVVRETPAALEARNAKPPTYATKSCPKANQYASACSCLGIHPSTKTVTPPEKTTTITRTTTVKKTLTSTTTALATATVTANPDDAVPTFGRGCSDNGIYQLLTSTGRWDRGINGYLVFDAAGIATLGESHREGSEFVITRSGLLRDTAFPNFALRTTTEGGGEGLSYVFGSEDVSGEEVVRCSIDENRDFQCLQGGDNKSVFFFCPANSKGNTIAIGNEEVVAAGGVGVGCQRIPFQLADPCMP